MYYSDFFDSLPYGIISKGACGCGATSFALENNEPIILCVPTVEMVKNKVEQYPNERRNLPVLGVYKDTTKEMIDSYINQYEGQSKILVTYDSLPRLYNHLDSFRIIIDEFSELLDAYSYRNKAINSLFDIIKSRINEITFISATPIPKEYLPDLLKDVQYMQIKWPEKELVKVEVKSHFTSKPINAIVNIINKYKNNQIIINGVKSEQAFFFVNSVKTIKDIVEKAELLFSEVHIICSNTKANENKLDIYDISTTSDLNKNPRKFNFITSTAFKGCDFYSETGISYIVSTDKALTTLLTIDTDIYQIAGRIRTLTNPFRNFVYHIYQSNPLLINEEQKEKLIEEKILNSNSVLDLYTKTDNRQKNIIHKEFNNNPSYYLKKINNTLIFDELMLLLEKRIYETVIKVYQNGLSLLKAYEDNNFSISDLPELEEITYRNFSNTLKEYLISPDKFDIETLNKNYPLILEAIKYLDEKKIKALGYNSSKLRKEIDFIKSNDLVKALVEKTFSFDTTYSNEEIKDLMQDIYIKLKLDKKAKAKDIQTYIKTKVINVNYKGKRVKGYIRERMNNENIKLKK